MNLFSEPLRCLHDTIVAAGLLTRPPPPGLFGDADPEVHSEPLRYFCCALANISVPHMDSVCKSTLGPTYKNVASALKKI